MSWGLRTDAERAHADNRWADVRKKLRDEDVERLRSILDDLLRCVEVMEGSLRFNSVAWSVLAWVLFKVDSGPGGPDRTLGTVEDLL